MPRQTTSIKTVVSAKLIFGVAASACLVMFLALAVVSVAHESRQQFGVLEQLQQVNTELAALNSRLKLEYSTLTEFGRVASVAEQLEMEFAAPGQMVVLP